MNNLKVGDKVRVLKNMEETDYPHGHNEGAIGVIFHINESGRLPLPYGVRVGERDDQWHKASNLELVDCTSAPEIGYCPHCGTKVTSDMETEDGIYCPKCPSSFWFSETLPKGWRKKGYRLMNDMLEEIGFPVIKKR